MAKPHQLRNTETETTGPKCYFLQVYTNLDNKSKDRGWAEHFPPLAELFTHTPSKLKLFMKFIRVAKLLQTAFEM